MNQSGQPDRFDAVVAEAPPLAEATTVAAKKAAAKLELGGDEIIQLSIKPALWYVPLATAPWITAVVVLGVALALLTQGQWTRESAIAYQGLIALLAVCVGIGAVRWASCTYVLTNRRVMRFQGLRHVAFVECPLTRIGGVDLLLTWYQRALGIGTIRMVPSNGRGDTIVWEHIAHPAEVHEMLTRAVRRSQSSE